MAKLSEYEKFLKKREREEQRERKERQRQSSEDDKRKVLEIKAEILDLPFKPAFEPFNRSVYRDNRSLHRYEVMLADLYQSSKTSKSARASTLSHSALLRWCETEYRNGVPRVILGVGKIALELSGQTNLLKWDGAYDQRTLHLGMNCTFPSRLAASFSSEFQLKNKSQLALLYRNWLASSIFRVLNVLAKADIGGLSQVTLNARVDNVAVVALIAEKCEILTVDYDADKAWESLKKFRCSRSAAPEQKQPIKPLPLPDDIRESAAPPSLDLSSIPPEEFERVIANLFSKLGFTTEITRYSRDGGIDCIAIDLRPAVGSKIIIQAKRYKETVSLSAVRDLYGTLQHNGANKGILIATSGFGPDAHSFVKGKPLELIDGIQLAKLLNDVGISTQPSRRKNPKQ
jgi:hypothetical protein